MSVFQQVMYELCIHRYKSSTYHTESQGAIEQFHQTLKNMLKHIVIKQVKTGMREFIFYCLLLETVQESLGFSPFEFVFEHSVLGPLKLYEEKLLPKDDCSLNIF